MSAAVRNLDEALPKIKEPKQTARNRRNPPLRGWRDSEEPRSKANRAMAKLLIQRSEHYWAEAESASRSNYWNYATVYRMFASRLDVSKNAADPAAFIRSMLKVFKALTEELEMIAVDLEKIAELHPEETKADK